MTNPELLKALGASNFFQTFDSIEELMEHIECNGFTDRERAVSAQAVAMTINTVLTKLVDDGLIDVEAVKKKMGA